MSRRLPYPWGEPPRRPVRRCICGRLVFWRRYRFCNRCTDTGRELLAELVD